MSAVLSGVLVICPSCTRVSAAVLGRRGRHAAGQRCEHCRGVLDAGRVVTDDGGHGVPLTRARLRHLLRATLAAEDARSAAAAVRDLVEFLEAAL